MHYQDPLNEARAEAWQSFIGDQDGIFRPRFGQIDWAKRYRDLNAWLSRQGRSNLCIPFA